jgi:arylsulfatase A-like enzyme
MKLARSLRHFKRRKNAPFPFSPHDGAHANSQGYFQISLSGLPQGLALSEFTLAELLCDAGYRSASYGKWHLDD